MGQGEAPRSSLGGVIPSRGDKGPLSAPEEDPQADPWAGGPSGQQTCVSNRQSGGHLAAGGGAVRTRGGSHLHKVIAWSL